jgi:hypothetical protein
MISGFDARLIELIESHPSIIVGTCDRALVPTMSRCFGCRVLDGGVAIELVVSRWPGPKTLENIADTGRIAVTFTAPETFVSYQIKGRVTEWGDCTPADKALAATCIATIRQRLEGLGEPPHAVRPIFTPHGLYRITIAPEVVFLQTPGKNAGQQL